MQIADEIALYVFGNNCIYRIMDLRRKLTVASNSLSGHISWDTYIILTANEEVDGADADNVHGKNGASAHSDLKNFKVVNVQNFRILLYKNIYSFQSD